MDWLINTGRVGSCILGQLWLQLGFLLLIFYKRNQAGHQNIWTTYFPRNFIFWIGNVFYSNATNNNCNGRSLPDHYSGTASGVNNAISRIANVFANAIIGALAILFFTGFLNNRMKEISLNEEIKKQVVAQAANLGDAKVPSIINGENKIKIEQDYKEGFINAYIKVMRICAALAALSALMAFIFIKNEELKKET